MSNFMWGKAVHDACEDFAREMGEARCMAQERVRTSIPDPFSVIHEWQAEAKKHPELRPLIDRTITLVLVWQDKLTKARNVLDDVVTR